MANYNHDPRTIGVSSGPFPVNYGETPVEAYHYWPLGAPGVLDTQGAVLIGGGLFTNCAVDDGMARYVVRQMASRGISREVITYSVPPTADQDHHDGVLASVMDHLPCDGPVYMLGQSRTAETVLNVADHLTDCERTRLLVKGVGLLAGNGQFEIDPDIVDWRFILERTTSELTKLRNIRNLRGLGGARLVVGNALARLRDHNTLLEEARAIYGANNYPRMKSLMGKGIPVVSMPAEYDGFFPVDKVVAAAESNGVPVDTLRTTHSGTILDRGMVGPIIDRVVQSVGR